MIQKLFEILLIVGLIAVFSEHVCAQVQWKVTTVAGDAGQQHTYTISDGSAFGKYRVYHYRKVNGSWQVQNVDPGIHTWLTADANGNASRTFTPTISGDWKVKVFPKTAGELSGTFEYSVGTGGGPS